MAVVCAGPKAILDVPATLEYLETRGVPVVAVGQADLPGFYARSAGIAAPDSVPDVDGRGRPRRRCTSGSGSGGAILVCVPVPEADALPSDVARDAVERAIGEAAEAGVAGPELTPWLLARIAALTEGASIRANTALIVNDAAFAGCARLAARLAARCPPIPATVDAAGTHRFPCASSCRSAGRWLHSPGPDDRVPIQPGGPTACGSTRAARARTSRRSSARSERSSTSAG